MTTSLIAAHRAATHRKPRIMHIPFKLLSLLSLTVIAASLSACGGGGGGTAVPPAAFSDLIVAVPASSFGASANGSAFDRINQIRLGAGAGKLAQSSALDLAAKNHTGYFMQNSGLDGAYIGSLHEGVLGGHYEDPANRGFYGKTAQERATKAGYVGKASELISFGAANSADCVESLENSVYHLAQIISPLYVDVGISFESSSAGGTVCAIELGLPSTTLGQMPAAGNVANYPYAGQTAVAPTFHNQAEAPIPAPDLSSAGHPVAVSLYSMAAPTLTGSDIVVKAFSMTSNGGVPVAVRVLARPGVISTMPNGLAVTTDDAIADAGVVFLLPTAPLAANTVYTVTFAATLKGASVNKDWSFTTGANR
jgi:hypothetical protein